MRDITAELAARLPLEERARPEVREMAAYGCLTHMHLVRLLAPWLAGETHLKEIDFSPSGIADCWRAGDRHTTEVLAQAPWTETVGPLEGLILHEAASGQMVGSAK
jgi:NTE family protein